jgi:hypothetical protein
MVKDCRGPQVADDGFPYCPRTLQVVWEEECEECRGKGEWQDDGHDDGGEE